jgi:hypothetical protein
MLEVRERSHSKRGLLVQHISVSTVIQGRQDAKAAVEGLIVRRICRRDRRRRPRGCVAQSDQPLALRR